MKYRIKETTNGLGEVFYWTEELVCEESRTHHETWKTFLSLKCNSLGGYFTDVHTDLKDAKKAIKDKVETDRISELRKQKTERIIPYED